MIRHNHFMTGFLLMIGLSGCSTFDCCHWWGRNTDGSCNLGKKPSPVQQGPIGGTYSNQGVINNAPIQPNIQLTATPVVTTAPAQSYTPAAEQNSPAITPPAPPSPLQSTLPNAPGITVQIDNRTTSSPTSSGSFPSQPSPATIISDLPENKPSIPSPVPPTPQVPGPTIPGQTPRIENSPMPLLLAPQGSTSQNTGVNMPGQPTIAMPDIAVPTIAKPLELAMPKAAGMSKNSGLNPGASPPPLPPNPPVPVFDGKDR